MTIFEIFILAVALAADAMLVSFSYGLVMTEKRIKNSFKLAVAFGFFQFIMPIIGWFLTGYIYIYIKNYSKWVVFTVFLLLGIKFFIESFKKEKDTDVSCISLQCLLCLSVATSIDALGAGVSLKLMNVHVLFSSVLIGCVTFILSVLGFNISYILKNINSQITGIFSACLFFYLAMSSIGII